MANLTGSTTAVFFVRLSAAVDEIVDVDWNTRDGTAIAEKDYEAASGTVSFLPGETEKTIDVIVYGQDDVSADGKKFYIELKPPANAVLSDALAECVITVADEDGVLVTSLVIAQGKRGFKGNPGLSAYEQAVLMGYQGTIEQWMTEIANASEASNRSAESAAESAASAVIADQKAAEVNEIAAAVSAMNDGQEYFLTQTALLASVPTVTKKAAKALDTKKVWLWQKPDTNPGTWTDTGLSELDQAKSLMDANGMFKPKTYASAVDFNTLTTYGIHSFLNGTSWNGSTNRPEQTAQWGHVLVLPTQGSVLTQIAFMGNVTKTFAMRLRTDTGVWQEYGYFHSFDKILELLKADVDNILNSQRTSSTVNQLNPNKVTLNYDVRPDGTLLNVANSAVSELIYCFNKENIYVSGLQSNNAAPRWYRFLNQNGVYISGGYINTGINEGYIPVPSGAYSFQISLKSSNNTNPLDSSTAQVEFSTTKTTYVAYAAGAISHINKVALANTQFSLNNAAAGKNLFNKNTALTGFEVYNDGRILAQATSISSAPILVKGLSNITISGLVQNPELVRYCVFKDAVGTVLAVVSIATTATSATFTVPANSETFQFSIKQRSAATPDLNIVQVESGTNITAYEAYARGFNTINGIPVVVSGSSTSSQPASRAFGAKYLMFGDSITQTSNVDTGDVTSSTYRSNWPKFAKDQLKMGGFKNYARSGASFLETGPAQTDWQKISHQVQTAITNAENPDVIVLACGTNDANIKLGTYDTAMSKAIADLDRTYTAEAMRWALYKIKENFPNAVCFYCTQLQRADIETTDRETANNLMVKLAKRYGFNIIDCMNESGILKDFELWQANGRYLSDGLHPNVSGQQVQANLIVSRIVERLSY